MSDDPAERRLARRRERYAEALADPYLRRRLREQQRAREQRIQNDPERAAKRRASKLRYYHRQKQRERTEAEWAVLREQRRVAYVQARERKGLPVGVKTKTTKTRVPAEPFRKWLFAYGDWIGNKTAEAIAPELGLVVRRVYAYMYDAQPSVVMELVDQAIARCPTHLTVDGRVIYDIGDLYPERFAEAA